MNNHTSHDPFEPEVRAAAELLKSNRVEDAERTYREILRKSPAHPAASYGLGMLLQGAGADETATGFLRTALRARPQHLESRYALAVSLYRLRRLAESADHFERILNSHPQVAEAHNFLGIVRAQLGDSGEAERHFLRALALRPEFAEAHKNLGTHYGEQGRIDEARAHLRQAIAGRPNYAQAYWQLASVTRFGEYDDDIRAMESSYRRTGAPDADRMGLAFALGKAFHDLRRYSTAFGYWAEGNALRRRLSGYSVEPALAEMQALTRFFPAKREPPIDPAQKTAPALIFIVGIPRSGTSLTEQILASHSRVHGAGELDALDLGIRGVVRNFPADLESLPAESWDAIRSRYLEHVSACARGAPVVSDKMPGNFIHIGAISVLFPDATIIHCRRDAMDTGLSCFRNHFVSDQLGFTCDLTDLGRYYNRYVDLMAHWHEASTARIHDIQYESLVSDPAGQIRRLLEYCDLPYEAGCLSFHENRRAVRTASAVQVRRPIYRDSVQGWKHYEKQLRPLRAALEGRRGRIGSRISGVIARFRGRSA